MRTPQLSSDHGRYLKILGVDAAPPNLDMLRALVRAHVLRVPFENVSKLLLHAREGAGRPLSLGEFLEGLECGDLGGTCYSSNPFLYNLLRALGYDAALFGADMQEPDVHTSVRVRLDGTEYHVDVGYAAPFTEPIALDRLPYTIASGNDRYVLSAANGVSGAYTLSHLIRGERRHGYVVHPPARSFEFFRPTILGSFERGRTFMRCLRISRYFTDRAVHLRNRTLTVVVGGSITESDVQGLEDLRRVVNTIFCMPRCPIEEAVGILERLTGRPFFGAERWADSVD